VNPNRNAPVLVTGGAGYIGSHVARRLRECDVPVVVLDNLTTGRRDAVLDAELVEGDMADGVLVQRILMQHGIQDVMHFAAHTVVPESVAEPLKYYGNNTCGSRSLLQACASAGVRRFIFSSTAAVYGTPTDGICREHDATAPINPYGWSKLMTEQMVRDLGHAGGPAYAILRYFNVAGADPEGRIGQSTPEATHLIKVASQAAVGIRDGIAIFGTDYPTPDGTGVRDYIHVEDLADAHLRALAHLQGDGESVTLNCGYGHGFSVREVIDTLQRVSGVDFPVREEARRAGDPACIVAAADRIRTTLGWTPRYDDLNIIVSTALAWERKLAGKST
jgi:UDP-glucose 4-epimerase